MTSVGRAVVGTAVTALALVACAGNGGSDPGGGPDPQPTGDPVAVYVTTKDGQRLAVAIMTNFVPDGEAARDWQGRVFATLAGAQLVPPKPNVRHRTVAIRE